MKSLGKLAGLAVLAMAGATGAAQAEATYTGNIALASDYTFRGISQTNEDPAVSGGFDVAYEQFYAGVWASTIDFAAQDAELEIDLYAGIKPVVGPVTLDIGVIGYLYPSASDDGSELDYVEAKFGASIAPAEGLTLGGVLYYSPEFTLDGGDALYIEGTAGYTISDMFAVSGGVGNQSVDVNNYFGPGDDSYTTWNVGGTLSWEGFGFDLRYVDTDLDFSAAEERVVFTIKRAL